MRCAILANGDLEFALDPEDDREEVRSWCGDRWTDLLDACGLIGNGWTSVAPEWIGALTDAPIVTNDFTLSDSGETTVHGRVWWFPNYCVEDPIETLVDTGRVVFTYAKPVTEPPPPPVTWPTENQRRFAEVYAVKLAEAIARHPEEYAYKVDKIPGVIAKMIPALARGSANVEGAAKATARALKIKATIGGIKAFLSEPEGQ